MTPDDVFYATVGVVAVGLVLLVPIHFALKKFFNINMRHEFYIALAEMHAMFYERKEQREAAANRGRTPVRHSSKH